MCSWRIGSNFDRIKILDMDLGNSGEHSPVQVQWYVGDPQSLKSNTRDL